MDKLGTQLTRLGSCVIAAVILLASMSKTGIASQAKGEASQSGAAELSVGSVTGNKYTNDSVGLTYVFPQGWSVDAAAMAAANDTAKKYLATHGSGGESKDYPGPVWLVVSKLAEKPNAKPGSLVPGASIILSGSTLHGPDEHKTPRNSKRSQAATREQRPYCLCQWADGLFHWRSKLFENRQDNRRTRILERRGHDSKSCPDRFPIHGGEYNATRGFVQIAEYS